MQRLQSREYLYLYVYKKDRRTLPKALQGLQHYNTSDYEDTSSGRHGTAPHLARLADDVVIYDVSLSSWLTMVAVRPLSSIRRRRCDRTFSWFSFLSFDLFLHAVRPSHSQHARGTVRAQPRSLSLPSRWSPYLRFSPVFVPLSSWLVTAAAT